MRRYTVLVLAILSFLLLSIYPGSLSAAPYYEGNVITIVVGYGPGGGYDRIARILAKNLPNYIPGKPTVLVQNIPGADSMLAAAKVAKDPVAQGDAKKNMMAVEYVPAQEVQKVLQYLLNQPPDIVKEFGKYVKF